MEFVKLCLKTLNTIPENYYLNSTIATVCEKGNVDVLKFLLNDVKKNNDQNLIKKLFIRACHKNHHDIIKYLFNEQMTDDVFKQTFLSETFAAMCESSTVKVETLQLLKTLGADINYRNSLSYINCCQNGRLDILEWLLAQGIKTPIYDCDHLILKLANDGHLELLTFCYKHYFFETNTRPSNITRNMLLKHGHHDVLKWMESLASDSQQVENRTRSNN